MSEMAERVARALALSAGARMAGPGQSVATREFGWKGDGGHLEQYVEAHWKEHEHAACFAIEAMRVPTAGMTSAMCEPSFTRAVGSDNGEFNLWDEDAIVVWQAGIDEALK